MTAALLRPTRSAQLRDFLGEQGMVWFRGPFNLNLMGFRHPERRGDAFDDIIVEAHEDDQGRELFNVFSATMDPGLHYLLGGSAKYPAHPDGTAMLLHGRQYRGCWKAGLHRGKYRALVQVKPMTFVRDADRDPDRDLEELVAAGKAFDAVIGCNLHYASAMREPQTIGLASAACQVTQRSQSLTEILRLLDVQTARGFGSSVSYSAHDWRLLDAFLARST